MTFLKALFWCCLGVDVIGLGAIFVFGLAATAPSKSSPWLVTLLLGVLPAFLLAVATWPFLAGSSPFLRGLGLAIVGAPFLALAVARIVGAVQLAKLAPGAIHGSTPLTQALRASEAEPAALERVRTLLAAKADPNAAGEELPLVLAIHLVRKVGVTPLGQLLEAGADPNVADACGRPAFFAATGNGVVPEVLEALLERGADPRRTARDGRDALWSAVDTRNWAAARLLAARGARGSGLSPMGLTLEATLEGILRTHEQDAGARELLAVLRARG